jgi:hypothetical protein
MTLLAYVDCEVADLAEFDSVVESGSSVIRHSADAAFPTRGRLGSRCEIVGSSVAYGQVNLGSAALAASEWVSAGMWIRLNSLPSAGLPFILGFAATGTAYNMCLRLASSGMARFYLQRDDASFADTGYTVALTAGRWQYLVVAARRASSAVAADGEARIYVDGMLAGSLTANDNYDTFATLANLLIGCWTGAQPLCLDVDEVKISTAGMFDSPYVEPTWSEPTDEYPSAGRTIALLADSADGRTFADDLFGAGLDRASVCYLSNASTDETLADYATWQSQVETDLLSWMTNNPLRTAGATTLLLGPGLPGFFTTGAGDVSATSRLMNIRDALNTPPAANPLYNPATIERITVSALRAADLYLSTRIDADTLVNARARLAASLRYSLLPVDPAELLVIDELVGSPLSGQRLRLETSALCADDSALAWNPVGAVGGGWGTGSRRLAASDEALATLDSLRDSSATAAAAWLDGWSAVLGSTAGSDIEPDAALKMLLAGGTLAEAAAVASSTIDGYVTAAGWGAALIETPAAGYNIYRDDVLVAATRPGVSSVSVADGLPADTTYSYSVTAVSRSGVESDGAEVDVTRSGGALVGLAPNRLAGGWARPVAAGYVEVELLYIASGQLAPARTLQVAHVVSGSGDWGSVLESATINGFGRRVITVGPFDDRQRVELAARALSADAVAGEEIILAPVTADASAPAGSTYVEVS